jgi:hypothetical protein
MAKNGTAEKLAALQEKVAALQEKLEQERAESLREFGAAVLDFLAKDEAARAAFLPPFVKGLSPRKARLIAPLLADFLPPVSSAQPVPASDTGTPDSPPQSAAA